MRIGVALAAAVVLSSLTVGCGSGSRNSEDGHLFVPKDWQPEQVSITCPSGDCPAGVGLFVLLREEGNGFEANRCTATLIESDRVLTNEHCSLSDHNRGYFILPVGQKTVVRKLVRSVYLVRDRMSGVGRDLAIWQLDKPIQEVSPLRVSRHVPAHLSEMVAYVMNTVSKVADDLSAFQLQKRQCHTLPHVPVLGVGAEDNAIGLALYDCEIRKGNSGSPVFAAGDLTTVEVVINTVWNGTVGEDHALNQALGYWFLDQTPKSLNAVFAMGERVHCLPIEGLPTPVTNCVSNQGVRQQLMASRRALIEKWYAQEPSQGMVWGVRVIDLFVKNKDGAGKLAVAVVPFPLCKKPGHHARRKGDVLYFQMGLNAQDVMTSKLLGSTPYNPDGDTSAQLDSRFRFARGQRDKWVELMGQPLNIQPCRAGSFAADSRAALEDIERFPMFNSNTN